jgi:hypothetical protein
MNVSVVALFIVSFVVGYALLSFSPLEYKTVFLYPTPGNYNQIQYKDRAGTCFHLKANKVTCDASAKEIPAQI